MQELKNFISKVIKDCNISIAIFDKKGKFLFGSDLNIKEVKSYKTFTTENGKTFFTFYFGGEQYIGVIDGIGAPEKNYAYIITETAKTLVKSTTPQSKEDFFKKLVNGKMGYLDATKYADDLKIKEQKCVAILISQEKGNSLDTLNVVANYTEDASDCVFTYDEKRTVLIKFIEGYNKEYKSLTEFAVFLSQTIYEETGINVTIDIGGEVDKLIDLEKSFSQALSVYSISRSVSLGGNVRSFREYVLIKILDDLPQNKKEEYLSLLLSGRSKDVFLDQVLCSTADEFFESNLNASLASRKTFLHRNTLTYRLDKIQKETGLDLRRYNDTVTFRLISALSKLLGKK